MTAEGLLASARKEYWKGIPVTFSPVFGMQKSERDSSFSLQKLKKHKGFGVECAMKI
ncbi:MULTISPECIES: hypothetical protein [Selenomonas]|uniref:hypothetical protein n=1 Tax=Selenomonas TaxID=970 RepID=UPI00027C3969|nr:MULTISPECIES: hypothetical protein [Selenomonas]EJU28959.1 hypothetical protein HMPREF1153_0638 [Selenomonas sp. CM52]UZE44406.1 hypothetical protein OL236_07200 [Selenomonas sputigena]